MSQLTQSPFLQALGYTIISSLWQFALLWLIYVSIHSFLKLSSHQKYVAGVLIQASGFVWFAITLTFYLNRFLQLQEIHFLQQKGFYSAFTRNGKSTFEAKFFAGILQVESALPYLSVAYLLILIFLCLKWIKVYKITRSIKTEGLQKIEVNWRLFVRQISEQLDIKREVKIYLSERVKTPLTIGFFKPIILIPLASLNHLTTVQMEAVILHELAHIKRFDYLFNLFLAIVEITLFFNPFTRLIGNHIKRERENCCDDWVLQYNYNPASYANALLQIATYENASLLAMQAADNKKVLLSRIKRMIEKNEKTLFNYRYQLMALAVMLTVLSSLAVLSSKHRIKNTAVSPSPRQVIAKPMIEIANSPLYNPDFFIAPTDKNVVFGKKTSSDKNENKKSTYNSSLLEVKLNDTNKLISNKITPKQNTAKALPPKPDPLLVDNHEDLFIENPNNDIAAAQSDLNEVAIPEAAIKEQEIDLAEKHLKELAKRLVEENKTLVDQTKIIQEIKAAFQQLKSMKIQLQASNQFNLANDVELKVVHLNQARIERRLDPCKEDQLQAKAFQLQMEKAEKQRKLIERNDRNCDKNNFRIPEVIFNLPFVEKPHSFSFEFSTEPKVKVAAPSFLHDTNRRRELNRKNKREINEDLQPQSYIPVRPGRAIKKVVKEDNLIIIKI